MKKEFVCSFCGDKFWREACFVARSIRNGHIIACKRGCSNKFYKPLEMQGEGNPAWKGGVCRKPFTCPMCQKEFIANPAKNPIYCSTECYGKAQSLGGSPNVGRPNGRNHHKYRGIVEKLLGRTLANNEVIHHKDGNYLNNDPSNLQVMFQTDHTRLHILERLAIRKAFEKEALDGSRA